MSKKFFAILLSLMMVFSLAVPAFAADGVHNNQPYPVTWQKWLTNDSFDAKNWDAVPDPEGLRGTDEEYILWHFQTGPAGTWNASALISFGDFGPYEMEACGENGSHYAIITPADWEITELVWESDTIDTQLRLSHTEYHPGGGGGGFSGALEIEKTVGAISIAEWVLDNYLDGDIYELAADISFKLYKANADCTDYDDSVVVAKGELNITDGVIEFGTIDNLEAGYYAVIEELGALAQTVFAHEDGIVGPKYFWIGTSVGGKYLVGGGSNFDFEALYWIDYNTGGMRVINYPNLNKGGEIFYIGIVNSDTGDKYLSYCAHSGSTNFAGDAGQGCSGYMVADRNMPDELDADDYSAFLSAYNYIEDNFVGGLADNRVITQVVTWALLGAIDVSSEEFDAASLSDEEKAAIVEVLGIARTVGYKGDGKIVDLVYMICDEPTHDFSKCQPQLVPLFSSGTFDNEPGMDYSGDVSFNKLILGLDGEWAYPEDGQFAFELWMMDVDEESEEFGEYSIYIGTFEAVDGIVNTGYYDDEGEWVSANLEAGFYVFYEVGADGYALANYVDGLFFELTFVGTSAKPVWELNNIGDFEEQDTPFVMNKELPGWVEVKKEVGDKVNIKDSITGGYASEAVPDAKGKYDHTKYEHSLGVLDKNTWFQYNEVEKFAGEAYHFDLVQGDKLNLVGGYTLSYDEDTELFTVTFDDALLPVGAVFSISNTIQGAKNANSATLTNIWTTSPGQQQSKSMEIVGDISSNSFSFAADWVDVNKTVYFYMHLDGLNGYANTGGLKPGTEFTYDLYADAACEGIVLATVTVVMNEAAVKFDVDLKPGTYYVKEQDSGTIKTVVVIFDQTSTVVF